MVDPGTAGAGLVVFFVIGLLGGAHCLGMCGPLVTMYADRVSGRSNTISWYELRQHALFNSGRTLSYAVIGTILGLLGSLFFETAAVVSLGGIVRAVTGVTVGIAIAIAGVGYVFGGPSIFSRIEALGASVGVVDVLTARVDTWVSGPRIVGLGAIHGLLPCPILYPSYLYALARGSPLEGGLSLGVLGLGTFPTLFLYGTAFGSLSPLSRAALHRVLGVAFIILGYLPLSMGLMAVGIDIPRPISIPIFQPLG